MLGYPTYWFLHGLLNEWGLELQHLNPTIVLHVAGFVTVCEAFLGDGATHGLLPAALLRASLVGGGPAQDYTSGGLRTVEEVEFVGCLPHILPL